MIVVKRRQHALHQSPFLTIMPATDSLISCTRFGSFAASARSLGSGTAMPRCIDKLQVAAVFPIHPTGHVMQTDT